MPSKVLIQPILTLEGELSKLIPPAGDQAHKTGAFEGHI